MEKRILCGFIVIFIMFVFVGCSRNESGDSLLAGGELNLEDLQDENGVYQLTELPIGTSKEDIEKRFGDSLNFGGIVDTYETSGLVERATYMGWDIQVSFELNNNKLELVYLYLRQPQDGSTPNTSLQEVYESLSSGLEKIYGAPSRDEERETAGRVATRRMWTSDSGEYPSMIYLSCLATDNDAQDVTLMVGLNQLETAQTTE